jgi:glycine dehydrogenase subunit 2
MTRNELREFHSARWSEPVIMEMGAPGRRGTVPPTAWGAGDPSVFVPSGLRRTEAPGLPEMSEPDVLRHYLHLSQQTMGMVGISLFGTCTMKYNPRISERIIARPYVADVHPAQDPATMQGVLQIVHQFSEPLSHAPIMHRVASWVSVPRSSRRRRRTRLVRQRLPRQGST